MRKRNREKDLQIKKGKERKLKSRDGEKEIERRRG